MQNVRTFQILDVFFDRYVFVSEWVRRFVTSYYGIDGPVIPAFIHTDTFRNSIPWSDREAAVLLTQRKQEGAVFDKFKEVYQGLFPGEQPIFEVVPIVPQSELAAFFARHKYYLSLDTMEGFGLPMLEAMSSGCTVVGWDSGGCREYARPGDNCMLARYGDFETLAHSLHKVLCDSTHAAQLSLRGIAAAQAYSLPAFENAWQRCLADFLFSGQKKAGFRRLANLIKWK